MQTGPAARLIRHFCAHGALVAVMLATTAPAWAQASAGAAAGQTAPAASDSRLERLRARTRQFDPSRFNLAVDGGLGLIHASSPYTLHPGEVGAGVSVLNYDRHPGDIDFFEYGMQVAVGVAGRLELFLRASPFLRTNSVNQEPIGFPVPPLDLVVDTYPTLATRSQPYFMFAQEVPFKSYYLKGVTINPPGHGAFAVSSGDVVVGGKVNLLSEDRGDPFGLGVRGYTELPTARPEYNTLDWRHAAGAAGRVDVGADLLFAKRVRALELVANVGMKHVGDPTQGLRVQFVDSSRLESGELLIAPAVETKLDLHDQVIVNVGTSFRAFDVRGMRFWMLGELGYLRYVGGGTTVERLVHPAEMRLGLQANVPRFPRLAIGAAWQLLLTSAGGGTTRQSRLLTPDGRGDINFSDTVDSELAAGARGLFESHGLTFWPNSSKVFSTDNPAFDAWRNVPASGTPVVALGGGNILGFITWRIR